MTAVERATLERLEDAINQHLVRIESKIDGMDGRLRSVEQATARDEGAQNGRKAVSTSYLQVVGLAVATAGVAATVSASIVAALHIHL